LCTPLLFGKWYKNPLTFFKGSMITLDFTEDVEP